MTQKKLTGAEIRKAYIDFFVEHGHTFVPSSSLVPGGDATLLFTNAGMVQFKDVFLGTDKRPYTRATNSQKCMRVAGKHNDLDDVGRDGTHHTFFEMLGNWSFGDYYKKEAITWAWQLLTEVWGLPRESLYATVFQDDQGDIPTDEEAATNWLGQPAFDPTHLFYLGRKDNFWEMAETGPCGPCSEIHYDLRPGDGPVTKETLDTDRFVELWNLVFIQYNRLSPTQLDPLPATHVDTGMGLDRLVSILQGVDSNYKTDLFTAALEVLRSLAGDDLDQMYANFTPYRVIVDHARAAAFLIADGVVPGNTGRNYVCRMIIRRAARFGSKLGLTEPFLAKVAEAFITTYGEFYSELNANRATILDSLTREEKRFARTVESGTAHLDGMLADLHKAGKNVLEGAKAFELYATYGLPFEITRDIAREQGLEVDEAGFHAAMDEHRLASGGGKAMGALGGEDAEFYADIFKKLSTDGKIVPEGVSYDPYLSPEVEGQLLSLVVDGDSVTEAQVGDNVEVVLPKTGFYVESGGQVSDTGTIVAVDRSWEIEVTGMRKPAAGVIVHVGEVLSGRPKIGDKVLAAIDRQRRHDIMRNHTATHLMHAELRAVLGEHARQAGSLVAPDRLRFDFTHPEAVTPEQLEEIERRVNQAVLDDFPVKPVVKSREQAISEGAMALFGEKYGETVRTISIGEHDEAFSYELCGGTHLEHTSDVGAFLILSEGSAAAGVRRIEAVTGRGAYELISRRFKTLKQAAGLLASPPDHLAEKVEALQNGLSEAHKEVAALRTRLATSSFDASLSDLGKVKGVSVLAMQMPGIDKDTLGNLADEFRAEYPEKGVCVIAAPSEESAIVMATVTQDLIKQGIKAGDLVGHVSRQLGAGGGGAPHLAFGGGRDLAKLTEALDSVNAWVAEKLA
jgi:alanyl-tRNA synthetase